jgi:hypothetical protein
MAASRCTASSPYTDSSEVQAQKNFTPSPPSEGARRRRNPFITLRLHLPHIAALALTRQGDRPEF